MLFAFSFQRFLLPRRRSQELGKRENQMSGVPGFPHSGSPGTLEGLRQARPFPRVAPPHTWIPEFLLTHLQLARPREPRISGPGAAKAARARPPGRRGAGLSAQARDSGEPPDAVRLETGSPPAQGRSRLGFPGSLQREGRLQRSFRPRRSSPGAGVVGEGKRVKKGALSVSVQCFTRKTT